MSKISDKILIGSYLGQRDQASLDALVKRYLPLVFGLVRKYVGQPEEAADITQDVFVKVWKNINKFDRNKDFKNWILTIAKNTAIDWLKKKKALSFSMVESGVGMKDFASSIADPGPSLLENLFNADDSRELSLAMSKIPDMYNKVIDLRITQDMTFGQISALLRQPLNTVKSRYRRGMVILKEILQK